MTIKQKIDQYVSEFWRVQDAFKADELRAAFNDIVAQVVEEMMGEEKKRLNSVVMTTIMMPRSTTIASPKKKLQEKTLLNH